MLRTPAILSLALVVLTSCASAHAPREVGSGIYDLTVRGDVDACSPLRATGAMGAVGIVASDGVLNVAVPDGADAFLARVSLARADGFHTEAVTEIPSCTNASLVRAWTVTETAPDRFALVFSQEWIGVDGCAAARETFPAAPSGDCRAEQILEYDLMEACPSPCEVRLTAGTATCACE